MDDRFDQEFYRSAWQRVLPIGPGGIQPYIRAAGSPCWHARSLRLRRLPAMLAGLANAAGAFARRSAIRIARRQPMPEPG